MENKNIVQLISYSFPVDQPFKQKQAIVPEGLGLGRCLHVPRDLEQASPWRWGMKRAGNLGDVSFTTSQVTKRIKIRKVSQSPGLPL